MTCQEFLQTFSDVRDGVAPEELRRRSMDHLDQCSECRRYREVVEGGVAVLQDQEPLEIPESFHPRLQHRLFHVDDEEAVRGAGGSGTPVVAVLGMAAVLTAAAWSPVLLPDEPEVQLSPIVVSEPPAPLRLEPVSFSAQDGSTGSGARADLWHDASNLLFQYSPVAERYRQRLRLRQAGLYEDR